MKPIRLTYKRVEVGQTVASELAYLPITVSTGNGSVELQGLLDSGSTVNVLPYTVGLALGFSWEQQTIPIALTGSLSKVPAYGVIVTGKVASFPPVELAFAWTQAPNVPLILGQVNFFMEFDVCFFRGTGSVKWDWASRACSSREKLVTKPGCPLSGPSAKKSKTRNFRRVDYRR